MLRLGYAECVSTAAVPVRSNHTTYQNFKKQVRGIKQIRGTFHTCLRQQ